MRQASAIYDKAMHEARKYWRDRLRSISFDPHVALDHPRPRNGERQVGSLELNLNGETSALLQRVTGGSPFLSYTVFLVGLKLCFSRYSGRRTVTILSPARSCEGGVVNLLPIDTTLDPSSTFQDLLLSAKDDLSGAFRYQQYSFSNMLLDLPEEGRPEHFSSVAGMVGFNDEFPDLACDIAVLFDTAGEAPTATFRFDRRLYEESTIRGFFRSFCSILRQGLEGMAAPVGDLNSESGGSFDASGDDVAEASKLEERLVHRLIENQVAKDASRTALTQGERALSYGALEGQANQLRDMLLDLELDVETPVAILMDAGAETVVSQLAVLKSGLAFAPIKPLALEVPVEEVLEALGCQCVLCRPEHQDDLQRVGEGLAFLQHFIAVECRQEGAGEEGDLLELSPVSRAAGPEGKIGTGPLPGEVSKEGGAQLFGIACVLTGGRGDGLSPSSLTHAELARVFDEMNSRLGIGPEDCCLLSPGLAACEQLYDTLGMLSAGASVEIPEASGVGDRGALLERLFGERITVWDLPAALALNLLPEILAGQGGGSGSGGPRHILLSGEKQSLRLADRLRGRFPKAQIVGAYCDPALGLWSTCFPLEDGPGEGEGAVLAEPIPGFSHRVLNLNGEIAARGTQGELHLERNLAASGGGAEPTPGRVATGLRVKRLSDGRLQWLRGWDHSFVKWGCRVELTKIEEILCDQEQIVAAEVVAVGEEQAGQEMVVAFVITRGDQVAPEEMRDLLVRHQDVDLVPDRFIPLEEFPLTVEGAIDREVLLKRFLVTYEREEEPRGPESREIQRQLREIWLEALQIDEAGDEASFFKLGGNSLRATLLIARIQEKFAVDLSVQDFFREPSIRAVAQLIEVELQNAGRRQVGPSFKAVSRERYRVQIPDLEG